MIKLSRARLTAAVFFFVFWGACSQEAPRKIRSNDPSLSVFRFRIPGDPPSLDPIHSADFVSQTVVNNIFDPLLRLDPETGELVPAIAERWEIEEGGLAFRFFLRRGVCFHNGRLLNAGDVRYSFERLLDPEQASERPWILLPLLGAAKFRAGDSGHVEGIKTLGDSIVVLRLERAYAPFLVQLTTVGASIVPREEVERLGDDVFGQEPAGSGPFRFMAWQHDSRIVLERFENYGQPGPPSISRVDFIVVPNISVALEKYRAGELDLLDQLPPGLVSLSQKRAGEEFHFWPGLSVRYLGFNLTRSPFKGNLKLRQAFNWAVNKEAIVNILGEGIDVVSTGAIPPGLPGRNSALKGYPYDPEKARQALAEAGYPGGKDLEEITLLYNNDPVDRRICEFVQACLAEIGVRIRLKSLEWAAFLAAVRAGESELFRGSWVGDFPDAHNFLYTLFHSQNWGDAGNYTRFANPQVDSLLTLAAMSADFGLREKLYREAEEIISYEAPWIFLFHPGQVALLKSRWTGAAFPTVGIWAFPLAKLKRAQ
ncbi:MAG TPA: ABC transporter substrate-binding protein [archaeon]|nr:ABC transporter substrate-binding protein [archaeon]